MRAESQEPTRLVRAFIATFLLVFVVCGIFGIEAWPLTGWRLFADARHAHQVSWRAAVGNNDGVESPLDFGDRAKSFGGAARLIDHFTEMSSDRRLEFCSTLLTSVRLNAPDAREVRLYRRDMDLSRRQGHRGVPADEHLEFVCVDGQVRAVS